ncbi:site-specific DNA-methyltransferase [Novosphingobium ginsenosidimutans]|uniref:site-specific DNA-methyltransferase (adenine-specific) n=1 Tax=Novosphingobium ginsenosidimutans TaxID=1176536 RepID=A0A5B8S5S5_9SPHN|nr:DNA methyltransferase [Novosphingobium ginsenosidimutans]QEA16448.1 DNA methylase N-4 [Novosphingobium ginsenosidimutans]
MHSNKIAIRRRTRGAALTSSSTPVVHKVLEGSEHRPVLSVEYLAIGQLREPTRKLRRYSKRHLHGLKASLTEFGMVRPVLVDRDNTIIAGVAIWRAAKELKFKTIPLIRLENLSPEQIRLYRIADNKLQMGEFVAEELRLEFIELTDTSIDLKINVDLEVTGFSSKEVDDVTLRVPQVAADGGGVDGVEDEDLEPKGSPVTRPGDIWVIDGVHKVICGNSLERETYAALMGEELAQMVVGDGPYNVAIKGNVSSRKDAKEFAFASGEQSCEEFIAFQRQAFRLMADYSIDGSIHYAFISWHFACELLAAGRAEYDELKNILIWMKTNASRGFYRSQHEMIAVFKSGTAPHICTFGIEEGARWRSNVIVQAGCNSFGPTRDEDLADHVTVKPVSLFADLMRDCSRRGGIVLDPWGGSGVTVLAAHWTGRRARLIEIDPGYVDVTIHRAAKRFGLEAVLAATGQSFAEVAAERLGHGSARGNDALGNGHLDAEADLAHEEDGDD